MTTRTVKVGSSRYPVLNAFMRSRARCSFIMGPLGSGKTYGAIQRILKQMCEQAPNENGIRPSRWYAIRNTYPDLTSTTIKDFLAVFAKLGTMKYGGLAPPTCDIYFKLEDGTHVRSEMVFLALDRPDAVRKLRGTQITGVWLNETKELVKPVVDLADGRHGRYPSTIDGGVEPTWHGMIGDTNAPDEDHWYYHLAEEERPPGWEFFIQPGALLDSGQVGPNGRRIWELNSEAENRGNLTGGLDYYTNLQHGKPDEWIRVFLANEYGFVSEGRAVHPQYVDSRHCSLEVLEVDKRYPLILGFDFGRTPAMAITQMIEHVARWHALDEFICQDMSAAVFAPEAKRYLDRYYPGMAVKAWGDPAGDHRGQTVEQTPMRILRAQGIPCQPAPSNEPLLRRAALANPMLRNCMDGDPAFLISPKMRITRKGLMGGFCYRRLKIAGEERYTDEPDKNQYSHPVEALEYGLLGGGEGREALRPPKELRRERQEFAIMDP